MSTPENNLPAASFNHLAVDDRLKEVAGSAFVASTPRKGARVINAKAKTSILNFSETLKIVLSTPKKDGTTLYADLVIVALDQALRHRDPRFYEMILNRTEGKPADRAEIELTNNTKSPQETSHDLSKLSADELKTLQKLHSKMKEKE